MPPAQPAQNRSRLSTKRFRTRRRRRRTRITLIALTTCALLGVGVAGVVSTLSMLHPEPAIPQRCAALLDGTQWYLSPDQAQNAALFTAAATERGLPARAVTIAIATALQESRMVNIDYGDRDSIGLFQQRPSQGWGSVEQIMEPVYSTGKFYDGLAKVPKYQDLDITVAAQAVQRSAFPEAYARHEARSRAWASALTGHDAGSITCALKGPARTPEAKDPTKRLVTRAQRDFPSLSPDNLRQNKVAGPGAQIDAAQLPGADDAGTRKRQATAIAHWGVAVAQEQDIVSVQVEDIIWTRSNGTWQTGATTLEPGIVEMRLAVAS